MGKYGESISERIKHVGKKQAFGYCVICGEWGRLVQDHVPPKGAIKITKVEQHLITELSGEGLIKKIKGVPSTNGSRFRTICQTCNGDRIGDGDTEIKKVHEELTKQISLYYQGASVYPWAVSSCNIVKYVKAMVGHILSATSSTECLRKQGSSDHFDPMKKLVIEEDLSFFETHDVYCWFYPYERHLSAKLVGFRNAGVTSVFSLLSFHPVAFMVVRKGGATTPVQATKINIEDHDVSINISSANIRYAQFPFVGLEGDQMYLLTDYLCTTSRPLI